MYDVSAAVANSDTVPTERANRIIFNCTLPYCTVPVGEYP